MRIVMFELLDLEGYSRFGGLRQRSDMLSMETGVSLRLVEG